MLTPADLTQMQAVQDQSMIDMCVIVTAVTVTGAYGGQQASTTESAPIKCGLSFNTGQRGTGQRGPFAAVDAVLRLPLGAVVNANSQVRITHRNGAVVTPQTYTVEGPVMPGRTCLIIGLKRLGV